MIGQTISHYRILGPLGKGGMGVVYVAEDTHLGRRVAVKFSHSNLQDTQFRARFLREARAASALNHPHIASIYDYGETPEGDPFLVMELVEGEDLSQVLRRGPMAPKEAIRIAADVADALAEAHRNGIIHRDIKPTNIVLDARGTVKVLDFGLAKQYGAAKPALQTDPTLTSAETMAGTIMGTPAYMSPEQAHEKPLGPASDLFALGAVLYECLAGRPAFHGGNAIEILAAVLYVTPPPPSQSNPSVTPEMDRITVKALSKNPEARYQSGTEMAEDLRRIEAGFSTATTAPVSITGARAPLHWRPLPPFARKWYWIAALLMVAALVAWWRFSNRPYRPSPAALRWYGEGVSAIRDGTYFKASTALERAVSLDRRFSMAHARLAEASFELDLADEARQQMLLAEEPDAQKQWSAADRLYTRALRMTLTGDFTGAIGEYRAIVARNPADADAYVDLGRAYERAEQPKDALASYLEASKRQAENPAAWLRMAIQYTHLGESSKAEAAFREAESLYRGLSNQEGITEVQLQKAVLADKLGRPAEARALLEQALEMSRHIGSQSQQIAVLFALSSVDLRTNNPSQAETDANQAIDLARTNRLENLTTRGLIDLGNAFFARGDTGEAKKDFEQAMEFAGRYHAERNLARAQLSLGSVETQRGEAAQGLAHVREALEWYRHRGYQRQTAQALTLIARTQRQQGDYPAALTAFEQQLALARQSGSQVQVAESQQGIGSVLVAEGRWSEALESFRQAVLAATQSGARFNAQFTTLDLGELLWRLGRYEQARQTMGQVDARQSSELAATLACYRAEMALSQRQFAIAISNSRELLRSPELDKDTQAAALSTLARALAETGARTEALARMSEAADLAAQTGDPFQIADTALAQAGVLLATGDSQRALERALAAREAFARAGNPESEWRCWLVAARAASALGDRRKSRQYAAQAGTVLADLGSKWAPEDYRSYLARPDIVYFRQQLSRLSAVQ
jgi:tetratricopeptide (TPR) repeat protein/predicted Ser/Thr protein kinase